MVRARTCCPIPTLFKEAVMTNMFTRKFALVGSVLALAVAATPAAALARHVSDDPAGDIRGSGNDDGINHVRGADDGLNHVRGADDAIKHVPGADDGINNVPGADDGPNHVRGGGNDDGPNHK